MISPFCEEVFGPGKSRFRALQAPKWRCRAVKHNQCVNEEIVTVYCFYSTICNMIRRETIVSGISAFLDEVQANVVGV